MEKNRNFSCFGYTDSSIVEMHACVTSLAQSCPALRPQGLQPAESLCPM